MKNAQHAFVLRHLALADLDWCKAHRLRETITRATHVHARGSDQQALLES